MTDFEVRGADRLVDLGKALRAAGDKEIRKVTLRTLREKAKPMGEAAKRNALVVLPAGGGLAAYVAKSRVSVRNRLTGDSAGVRIVGLRTKAGGSIDLERLDDGRLRHPTFGHRPWVLQDVPEGWWSDAMEREAPSVMEALADAIENAIDQAAIAATKK